MQITLHAGLVIAPNPAWVRHPWPAPGLRRFVEDLALHFFVRQYVLEVLGQEERGHRGYGPVFAAQANRIGARWAWGPCWSSTAAGATPANRCVPAGHATSPDDFYGADITPALLAMSRGGYRAARRSKPPTANAAVLEFLLWLLQQGQVERVEAVLR